MTQGDTLGKRVLVPEDLLALRIITDAQLSPDGQLVAYVVKTAASRPQRIWQRRSISRRPPVVTHGS